MSRRDRRCAPNKCGNEVDVLIAFVPEASMGTAIEMWEAYKNAAVVLTISPLAVNWAVRFLSDMIYRDLPEFFAALESGEINDITVTANDFQKSLL